MKATFTAKNRSSLLALTLIVILPSFLFSCKKNKAENSEMPEEVVLQLDDAENEDSFFYSPAEDDAAWVDSLLMHSEEERIADELAKMEESYSDYQFEETEPDKENKDDEQTLQEEAEEKNPVEQFFEEAKEGNVITDRNSQMSFYEFENEILVPQHTSEGLIVVRSTGENVIRSYYDEKSRLSKKEEWIIKNAADALKLRTEKYTWSEDNGKVEKKEILTEDTLENVTYNKEGSPLLSKKYAVIETKNFIISERKWNYDSENRVIKDELIEYKYKDEKYKKLLSTFVRNYEYDYRKLSKRQDKNNKEEEELPPDTKYYENGILKKANLYSSEKGNYISWVYFDESLSVKTFYEDYIRIKDEYYNNGKVIRTKVYEKPEEAEKTDSADETKTVIHQGGKE